MAKRRRGRQVVAILILVLPVVALLWVPSYAVADPRLVGLPFFYWYQLAWIPLSILAMLTATVLLTQADSATARRPARIGRHWAQPGTRGPNTRRSNAR
jgi:Protein of unknown function (DUF3311)